MPRGGLFQSLVFVAVCVPQVVSDVAAPPNTFVAADPNDFSLLKCAEAFEETPTCRETFGLRRLDLKNQNAIGVFLHQMKTAGTSFSQVLQRSGLEVCAGSHVTAHLKLPLPGRSEPMQGSSIDDDTLRELWREKSPRCHIAFFHEDFGIAPMHLFPAIGYENVGLGTLFRDPVDLRVALARSGWKHSIERSAEIIRTRGNFSGYDPIFERLQQVDFINGVYEPDFHYGRDNILFPTYFNKAYFLQLKKQLEPDQKLSVALQNLRHFYFVGLTGQYDESVCLWSFTFHWPSLRFVDPKSNLRHKVPDSKAANFEPKLPADAQEKLEGWIEPELRLYNVLKKIFSLRLNEMRTYFKPGGAATLAERVAYEANEYCVRSNILGLDS